jgi:hypothetical protein
LDGDCRTDSWNRSYGLPKSAILHYRRISARMPKQLRLRLRVVGTVPPIIGKHGLIVSSVGKKGEKRWFVNWDENVERIGFTGRSLTIEPRAPGPEGAGGVVAVRIDGSDDGDAENDSQEDSSGSTDDR